MNKNKTNPQSWLAAPGLPESSQKAALLTNWAYQTGHLHALQLLDAVVTFRERQTALPATSDDAGQAILQGFAETLEPVLGKVLDYVDPSKREHLPRLLLEGLADAATSLFERQPPCRKDRP